MSFDRSNADILAVALLVVGALLAGVGLWSIVQEGSWGRGSPVWDAATALFGLWAMGRGVKVWRRRRGVT